LDTTRAGQGKAPKVLLCGLNYAPELIGAGKYSAEMAEWLSANGVPLRVVTSYPYYPEWKLRPGYSRHWYHSEDIQGIKVIRCPIWVPKEPSAVQRIFHLLSFGISSFFGMISQIFWRPDIIVVVAPTLTSVPAAIITSWFTRSKRWIHVQDYEVGAAFELGLMSRLGILRSLATRLERFLISRFDVVSTISEKMVTYAMDAIKVPKEKVVLVPNWAELERFGELDIDRSQVRMDLGWSEEAIVALYAGNIGEKQGLEIILEAAKILGDRQDIHFVICGDGLYKNRLKALASKMGLTRIQWMESLPSNDFESMMRCADIHLVTQLPEVADLVLPSKVGNILASGGPMVVTAERGTQLGEMSEHGEFAERVSPNDPKGFSEAIVRLAESSEKRTAMSEAAGIYSKQHFDREVILGQMKETLESLNRRR